MGKLKGQTEYEKFLKGDRLSPKRAILAQCYQCNGFEQSGSDCGGKACPLYAYSPYKGKRGLVEA